MSSMPKSKEELPELASFPSQAGEVHDVPTYVTDDVFGEVTENGPNYRNVRDLQRTSCAQANFATRSDGWERWPS
jgi:hypothetical protein